MDVSARSGLSITALLALITMQIAVTSNLSVSYVTAINIWMMICIFFVFLTLVELALVMRLDWNKKEKRKRQLKEMQKTGQIGERTSILQIGASEFKVVVPEEEKDKDDEDVETGRSCFNWGFISRNSPNKLDGLARIIFPYSFLAVAFVFFSILAISR